MTNDNALLITETVDIVSSYVSKNSLPASEVASFIMSVNSALKVAACMQVPSAEPASEVEKASGAEIRKSITPDALISFIDGKPYKTLRRHLTTNGLTPDAYRARYGLPADYPLVCPNYSEMRSALAKSHGLGQQRRKVPAAA